MKTHLLIIGALFSPALACESDVPRVTHPPTRTAIVAALAAAKPAKQPTPAAPSSPTSQPTGKQRESRPTPPAHLFM